MNVPLQTNPRDHITSVQTTVLVASFILGVGILTLPRTVSEKVGTGDVWISVILGGLLAMLLGMLLAKISLYFPGQTLYEYSRMTAGKWVGGLINLIFAAYFTCLAGFEIRVLAEVTSFFLLPTTPREVTMGVILLASIYLVVGGINPIARLYEIFLPVTVILFFMVLLMGFKNFDIDNLRPLLEQGWMPVIKGTEPTTLSYLGFETMLFLPAFMEKPRHAIRAVLAGIAIPMLFYMLTVIVVVGVLTIDDVVTLTFPTIELVRSFELTGIFFERYESFLFAVWILQIFTTLSLCHYLSGLGLSQLFRKQKMKLILYGLLPVMFVVALLPNNINDVFTLGYYISYWMIGMAIVIPSLLFAIAKMRGMLNGKQA